MDPLPRGLVRVACVGDEGVENPEYQGVFAEQHASMVFEATSRPEWLDGCDEGAAYELPDDDAGRMLYGMVEHVADGGKLGLEAVTTLTGGRRPDAFLANLLVSVLHTPLLAREAESAVFAFVKHHYDGDMKATGGLGFALEVANALIEHGDTVHLDRFIGDGI